MNMAPTQDRVYLTFDDGPDDDWTPRILDLLAEASAPATFFVIGCRAKAAAGVLRRSVAEGHEIGNHGWSHRHPFAMSARRARAEVADGAKAIADLLGRPARHFRPPHGRIRPCMVDEARAQGQTLVLWNLSAIDWGPMGGSHGIARRLRRAAAGDIVLMHDGNRGINRTAELAVTLPAFLVGLGQRGLRPALLS
jgi:peptidoglycan/xylan/chitin deacetylase (PgdA/CDA1 family)